MVNRIHLAPLNVRIGTALPTFRLKAYLVTRKSEGPHSSRMTLEDASAAVAAEPSLRAWIAGCRTPENGEDWLASAVLSVAARETWAFFNQAGPFMFFDAAIPPDEWRNMVFHELGHYVCALVAGNSGTEATAEAVASILRDLTETQFPSC